MEQAEEQAQGASQGTTPDGEVKFGYFDDDAVLEGTFPGTEVLPAVRFKYHPMDTAQAFAYFRQAEEARNRSRHDAHTHIIRNCIQRYVKWWDLQRPVRDSATRSVTGSETVPLTDPTAIAKVSWTILEYIARVIQETSAPLEAEAKK